MSKYYSVNRSWHNGTWGGSLKALFVTFSLGALATIFGAIIAFFGSLLCAKNIANPYVANITKSFVAFIRAVPTILWVLIFTVAAGLGSVAAVIGLTFHSAGYLIKAYAESIEEMDEGTIEALKASGASFWANCVSSYSPFLYQPHDSMDIPAFWNKFYQCAGRWGAAAGVGGIGFDLYMAGNHYFGSSRAGITSHILSWPRWFCWKW